MSNTCKHEHNCFECTKPYKCENPECQSLPGLQGCCPKCLWEHGWRQAKDRGLLESF